MSIGVVRGIEMVSKWCLKDIRIEREFFAFTPGRDIWMLTLDEVEDGSCIHVHKPRRDIRREWAKFDFISAKFTFFSKFPSILKNPEIYRKARGIAFPAYLPPHQDIQIYNVMLALQNDSEMGLEGFL